MQQSPSNSNISDRLLRLPEVEYRTGMKKSGIYDAIKKKTFPSPVKLSRRAVCWPESAIQNWITDRIKGCGKTGGEA